MHVRCGVLRGGDVLDMVLISPGRPCRWLLFVRLLAILAIWLNSAVTVR